MSESDDNPKVLSGQVRAGAALASQLNLKVKDLIPKEHIAAFAAVSSRN